MLAELDPKPDQVTVTVNTSQMNILEHMAYEDIAGTSMEHPEVFNAYKEMTVPAQPGWVEEHIRRLSAAGIQSAFQCYNINSFESVERLMRRGIYKGPLVMNWVAISGGMDLDMVPWSIVTTTEQWAYDGLDVATMQERMDARGPELTPFDEALAQAC